MRLVISGQLSPCLALKLEKEYPSYRISPFHELIHIYLTILSDASDEALG